jgi:hypothetical protein
MASVLSRLAIKMSFIAIDRLQFLRIKRFAKRMHMVNGVCVTPPARRQARRCLVWRAGHVCRKWG